MPRTFLRLVVVVDGRADVVDLSRGRAWSVDVGGPSVGRGGLVAVLPPTAASPAGEVVVQTTAGIQLVPLDGGKLRTLGTAWPGVVFPRAGGGAWLANGIDVSTLTAGGSPVPVGQLPMTAEAVDISQPADRLVIRHRSDDSMWLWDPTSGREARLSEPCTGPRPVLGGSATTIVSLPCGGGAGLVVTDIRTRSSRHVSPTAFIDGWNANNLVRPDGGALAVTRDHPPQVWYFDLATGHARKVLDGTALGWSPDGRWLAVSTPTPDQSTRPSGTRSELVRLWSPHGPAVTVARIAVSSTAVDHAFSGALVP